MKNFFQGLFAYHHHFTPQLIDLVEKHQTELPEKTTGLLSHILNAHNIWNARILGTEPVGVFEIHPFDVCRTMEQKNHADSLDILDRFDLEQTVRYTNTQGKAFENNIRDMLFQVINHTTHHRGQIISAIRQIGAEPIASDYIFFMRKPL